MFSGSSTISNQTLGLSLVVKALTLAMSEAGASRGDRGGMITSLSLRMAWRTSVASGSGLDPKRAATSIGLTSRRRPT